MAIGSAIERGSLICVSDKRGITLFQKARGSGPKDGLLEFTGSPSACASARSSTPTASAVRRYSPRRPIASSSAIYRAVAVPDGMPRSQITSHQRDKFFLDAGRLPQCATRPRVHALCIGGVEPHDADTGRSTRHLDSLDQVDDVTSATRFWDDEHTS